MRKNTYVVTPRCDADAAVVSAVVLRRPTKEYTHPYSVMHRRFPTAGIEVAPHYHQLLVMRQGRGSEATEIFAFRQKSLSLAGRTSVGCQKLNLKSFFCIRDVSLFVCLIQHRSWPLTSTILNAHGTNASPDGLCTRTHTNEAFSSWFCCNSFRVDRARRGNVFIKPSHALLPISLSGNLKMVWVLI